MAVMSGTPQRVTPSHVLAAYSPNMEVTGNHRHMEVTRLTKQAAAVREWIHRWMEEGEQMSSSAAGPPIIGVDGMEGLFMSRKMA
mmetsp:Transcript_132158/g.229831  ORF Transcript_132158/g.229831 Transcript_132158/m.229831 type:complete len:85 (-) Transcript_132158:301-555(-)